ncbi:hypothetical protein K388_07339 [Streptomyces sp. KhCrAH-43]|uniref:hypothetical protein n=1 Tax=unclassified Streptomyces TaxID=2593676 RepID=UPI00035C099B|nr:MULTISPECIES: hypothetical protein [unclassified Streptomyces]MYS33456.1 hypothetical protein [Streptomyces sp. SID4920]MYX63699.1 hypothetical protein [Streptomyces sp. SID8373]RAJ45323.1 hypothetical protein K388_07339 [Streptomyces sp. KhCrAH-43]
MATTPTATAGRTHLHTAITHDAPGPKFIRAAHFWNGTTTVHRTEVLYAGDGLLLAGDAETQLAPIIQTLDSALRRGVAVLEIVTEHATTPTRLTIQRYYLYNGRHYTDAAFDQELCGHDPALLADAERARHASHAASLRRVQREVDERQAEHERSAARIAREMQTRAFWLRRHREHLARARGSRRAGEHKWHAYALNAAAFARSRAAAIPA